MGCFFRSTAGIAHGDVAPTAITLVGLALVGAATMPWGVLPQIVTAGIAGIAIAINLHFVDGDLPRQAVTAVLIGPRSVDQFDPAVESLQVGLTADDRDRILGRMEASRAP